MKNIKQSFLLLILLGAIGSFSSCAVAKMNKLLTNHELKLNKASMDNNINSATKFDLLAETLVTVLDESLNFKSIKRSVQHVNKFSQQNQQSIDRILTSLNDWKANMSPLDQVAFWAQVATKPYARKLVTLIPRFEKKVKRKIKTFTFAAKVLKFLIPKRLMGPLDLN